MTEWATVAIAGISVVGAGGSALGAVWFKEHFDRRRSLGEHNMSVRDMDALVDFVRRMQIPGYEQARRLYGDPEIRHSYADATESYPYRQESIDSILRSTGQRGPSAR